MRNQIKYCKKCGTLLKNKDDKWNNRFKKCNECGTLNNEPTEALRNGKNLRIKCDACENEIYTLDNYCRYCGNRFKDGFLKEETFSEDDQLKLIEFSYGPLPSKFLEDDNQES